MSIALKPEAPPGAYEERAARVDALAARMRELAAKWREIAKKRRRYPPAKYLSPFMWLFPFNVLFLIGQGGGGTNALLTPNLGRPGTTVGVGRGKFL